MRYQINQYLRELPKGFDSSYHRIFLTQCKHCRSELYNEWVFPEEHATEGDIYFKFEYNGERDWISYSKVGNAQYRSDHMRYSKIPETELQKQFDLLLSLSNEQKKAENEFYHFRELKHCPVCHQELEVHWFYDGTLASARGRDGRVSEEDFAAFQAEYKDLIASRDFDWRSKDTIFLYFNFLQKRQDKFNAAAKLEMLHTQLDIPAVSENVDADSIKGSLDKLKKHVQHLFTLETNVYSVEKHLLDLYMLQFEANSLFLRHKGQIESDVRNQVTDTYSQYEIAVAEFKRIQSAGAEKVHVARPEAPRKPSAPIFEKPGLFNKKKVLAHNAELAATYEKACQQYERDIAAHKSALEFCTAKEAQLVQEAEERYARSLSAAEAEVAKAKAQMEQSAANINAQIEAACALPSPETVAKQMLDDEIVQAETLLKELIECRNKLYACDVVFIKYRNMVALATFYEYLISGRCTTLEGADGAYNIFESECRANQIIGQLNKIVDSLEQIKESQYLIYSQLQSINSSLTTMNATMQSMSESLQSIQADTHNMSGYMEKVAQNSDVIAHNSAVSAYYSKMNAELTNSLGYLVALH